MVFELFERMTLQRHKFIWNSNAKKGHNYLYIPDPFFTSSSINDMQICGQNEQQYDCSLLRFWL